jgi:hypothetical protein
MKIALVIATTGRPAVVMETLRRLERQSPAPDAVLVVGANASDVPPGELPAGASFALAPAKGLPVQRNHALDLLQGDADIIAFIDDDYAPASDFVAGVERLMREHRDVVAASGTLLADGIHSQGLSFEEADALIALYERSEKPEPSLTRETGTYGCNMIYRVAAAPSVRFDENLPLYAWLEDTDFSAQYARIGQVVRTNACVGVHLGVKLARVAGVRLGYSQIANPLYLVAKGTVTPRFAINLALRNVAANVLKALRSEPWIDRRGRLRGNLLALRDALLGRSHPLRILEM